MIESGKRPDHYYATVQLCAKTVDRESISVSFTLLDAIKVMIYPMDDEAFGSGNADDIYTLDDDGGEHLASGVLHDLLAQALRASPHWPPIRVLGARNAREK